MEGGSNMSFEASSKLLGNVNEKRAVFVCVFKKTKKLT